MKPHPDAPTSPITLYVYPESPLAFVSAFLAIGVFAFDAGIRIAEESGIAHGHVFQSILLAGAAFLFALSRRRVATTFDPQTRRMTRRSEIFSVAIGKVIDIPFGKIRVVDFHHDGADNLEAGESDLEFAYRLYYTPIFLLLLSFLPIPSPYKIFIDTQDFDRYLVAKSFADRGMWEIARGIARMTGTRVG